MIDGMIADYGCSWKNDNQSLYRVKNEKMIETVSTKKKKLTKLDLAIYVMVNIPSATNNVNTSAEYVIEEEATKIP